MEKRTVKQNGGKRAGAGRKKAQHTIASEKAREYLITEVVKNLKPIVEAQIEAAKGISYVGEKGRVYTQLPDTKVGEYLLNQVAGKAVANIDMDINGEQPLLIMLDK
ncbi:MAG: hypothetical protein Q7R65_04735 [bacterium]|nr:hypothetical protein [bacterium]